MVDADEITDLQYHVIDAVDPNAPNLYVTGRYRGVEIFNRAWVSAELFGDKPVLEQFLTSILLRWAQENWPPPVPIDSQP